MSRNKKKAKFESESRPESLSGSDKPSSNDWIDTHLLEPLHIRLFGPSYNKPKSKEELTKPKSKEELIIPLECIVESATGYISSSRFTPKSEITYGGPLASYCTGDISLLELEVITDKPTPIKRVTIRGAWPIESGDRIRAYIFKGEFTENDDTYLRKKLAADMEGESLAKEYNEREFKEKEEAYKIPE